jgi:hypothetical protein
MPELTLRRFHSKMLFLVRSGLRTEIEELELLDLCGKFGMLLGSFHARAVKGVADRS